MSLPVNPLAILARHYDPASNLYRVLVIHSALVAAKALAIARSLLVRRGKTAVDLAFLGEAALLHDIGIGLCHAPKIFCEGAEPYVRHGVLGRDILENEGLPRHALVCARHTGAGLTREDVRRQGQPLADEDYLPLSIEEKIICVADKFYSKTPHKLWIEKPLDQIEASLAKHGPDVLARWEALRREVLD